MGKAEQEALLCLEMAVVPAPVNSQDMLLDIRTHRASLPGNLDDELIEMAEAGRA